MGDRPRPGRSTAQGAWAGVTVALVAVAAATVATAVYAAPVGARAGQAAGAAREAPAPSHVVPSVGGLAAGPAVAPPPAPPAATGVGTVTLDLSDASRPTVAQGRVLSAARHLPTIVRYPAVGPRGAAEQPGARAAAGPWPLIVFAHGYDVTPGTYGHLLHAWAAAGFVVAAPAFPLETAGGPLDESDLAHEPADISAVITAVLQRSAAGSGPLSGLVDPSRIAVAGHSDGAVAALGAAFGPGDARIGPVIAMAGAAAPGVPHPDARHPLLVVQGTDDTTDNPRNSDQVYSAAGRPRVFLSLVGAGHLPPIADDTPWRPVVEAVTALFLRHYLGEDASIAALAAAGTQPGVSRIGGQA